MQPIQFNLDPTIGPFGLCLCVFLLALCVSAGMLRYGSRNLALSERTNDATQRAKIHGKGVFGITFGVVSLLVVLLSFIGTCVSFCYKYQAFFVIKQ